MAPITREDVENQITEARHEAFKRWPVDWSAVLIGALAAVAMVTLVGLVGAALGLHFMGVNERLTDFEDVQWAALAISVFGAFLSFVVGGWVAGKVAGVLFAEHGILHGAVAWLIAVPLLVALGAAGSASITGGWYAGLTTHPAGSIIPTNAERAIVQQADRPEVRTAERADAAAADVDDDAARVARNTALGAVTALLLGLMGGVVGGWMACGEPMSLTYKRATN
jgi:hypothetical protein